MGRKVHATAARPPARTRRAVCSECGQTYSTINGAWLRYCRQRAGIDQRTLAGRLGVSGPYLSDLERNRRAVPRDILTAYGRLRVRPR